MKLNWIDRLLIKVALAKAAARGHLDIHLADRLTAAISGECYMPGPLTGGSTVGLNLAPKGQGAIAAGGSVLGRSNEPEQYRQALELARHELTTLNGLIAADGAAPSETWSIDTSAVIQAIDAALNEAS